MASSDLEAIRNNLRKHKALSDAYQHTHDNSAYNRHASAASKGREFALSPSGVKNKVEKTAEFLDVPLYPLTKGTTASPQADKGFPLGESFVKSAAHDTLSAAAKRGRDFALAPASPRQVNTNWACGQGLKSSPHDILDQLASRKQTDVENTAALNAKYGGSYADLRAWNYAHGLHHPIGSSESYLVDDLGSETKVFPEGQHKNFAALQLRDFAGVQAVASYSDTRGRAPGAGDNETGRVLADESTPGAKLLTSQTPPVLRPAAKSSHPSSGATPTTPRGGTYFDKIQLEASSTARKSEPSTPVVSGSQQDSIRRLEGLENEVRQWQASPRGPLFPSSDTRKAEGNVQHSATIEVNQDAEDSEIPWMDVRSADDVEKRKVPPASFSVTSSTWGFSDHRNGVPDHTTKPLDVD
eukprot:gene7702-9164_t